MASTESQALKTHTTVPSLAEDLKNNIIPTPLSYSHTEISKLLTENASKPLLPELSEIQRTFIVQSLEASKSYNPEEFKAILEKVFDIFDDALYFGLLKNHLDLDIRIKRAINHVDELAEDELAEDELAEEYQQDGAEGFFTDYFKTMTLKAAQTSEKLCPEDGQKPTIRVNVYNDDQPDKFYQKQMRYWVGVLLHESVHSFFGIFGCKCWKGCYTDYTDPVRGVGFTGHGAIFCQTLEALRDFCIKEFGLHDMPCGFDCAAYPEIRHTGWKPLDDQMERWGLDPERVERILDDFDEEKSIGLDHVRTRREEMDDWLLFHDKSQWLVQKLIYSYRRQHCRQRF